VIVVVNMARQALEGYDIGFPRAGKWKIRFNGDWSGHDSGFGNHRGKDVVAKRGKEDGMPCNGNISIEPYCAIIFSQDM